MRTMITNGKEGNDSTINIFRVGMGHIANYIITGVGYGLK